MRLFIVLIINILALIPSCNVQANTLYIIAHKESFSKIEDTKHIADFYLLKRKFNAAGKKIIPINLPSNHPLRNKFSQVLFHRSPIALGEYWDRMSFRGVKPPLIQNSEKAVLLFVERIPGAVGYVNNKPSHKEAVIILKEIEL